MKKKLCILSGPLDNQNAGVHIYTKEFIKSLHSTINNELDIYLIREKQSDEYPKFKTIYIPQFGSIPGFASFRLFILIPFICTIYKFDFVFEPAHFGPFNLPPWIKRITFIHDLTPIIYPQYHTFNGWFLHRLFLKRILAKTHFIITNSINSKKDIIEYLPSVQHKTYVNYLGLRELPKITNSSNPNEKQFFLYVGTFEPRKNIETLISAYEIYCAESLNPKDLILIGNKGWKNRNIFEKIKSSPFNKNIRVIGFVSIELLSRYYQSCFTFIYPSSYEGFGLPVLEAMAYGKVPIVANNSALTEIYSDVALMFDTFDPRELCDRLKELENFKTKERKFYKKSSISKIDQLSWENHVIKFKKILTDED